MGGSVLSAISVLRPGRDASVSFYVGNSGGQEERYVHLCYNSLGGGGLVSFLLSVCSFREDLGGVESCMRQTASRTYGRVTAQRWNQPPLHLAVLESLHSCVSAPREEVIS